MNSHEITSIEGMTGNESKNEALVEDEFGSESRDEIVAENRIDKEALAENRVETDKLAEINRFGKNFVYTRRLMVIPESTNVQETDPSPLTQIINIDVSGLHDILAPHNEIGNSVTKDNHDLLIVIRKGVRECKKSHSIISQIILHFKKILKPIKSFLQN